jgi:hypothetical protein
MRRNPLWIISQQMTQCFPCLTAAQNCVMIVVSATRIPPDQYPFADLSGITIGELWAQLAIVDL